MTILTTWINGLNNTYEVKNGIIQSNSYLLTEAYSRIVTPIGSYEFDLTFGSYLPLWINKRLYKNENQFKLEIQRAIAPMYTEGRCSGQLIKINQLLPNKSGIYFTVSLYDSSESQYELIANYVKN